MVDSIEEITFIVRHPFTTQALREGPTKGAGWIDADCRMAAIQLKAPHVQMQYQPLRYHRTRLYEADPSPALWAAPFSKGGTCLMVDSIEKITFIVSYPVNMQALREGPTKGAGWIDADCRIAAIQLKAPHVCIYTQPTTSHT